MCLYVYVGGGGNVTVMSATGTDFAEMPRR